MEVNNSLGFSTRLLSFTGLQCASSHFEGYARKSGLQRQTNLKSDLMKEHEIIIFIFFNDEQWKSYFFLNEEQWKWTRLLLFLFIF